MSGGQARVAQDEWDQDDWDQVWQDYDRRRPVAARPEAPPSVHAATASGPPRRFRHGTLLALAACLLLPPLPEANRPPARAEVLASLVSLAPDEAEMPPLTTAVSRLAAESVAAACWVMRLAPQAALDAAPGDMPCPEAPLPGG